LLAGGRGVEGEEAVRADVGRQEPAGLGFDLAEEF
jgi:hypothetical protein